MKKFIKNLLNKRLNNEKGLTLIELLAVIVILAIIAAIAIPAIGNIIQNSRDKAVLSEAANLLSGAKIAIADGACSEPAETTGAITCDDEVLAKFFDGPVAATDSVVFTPATDSADAKYEVTFDEFSKVVDKKRYLGADNADTTLTETEILEGLGE